MPRKNKVIQTAGDTTHVLTSACIFLKEGKKEDFIQAIEDGYNSSSCAKFPAEFILESEVFALMKRTGQE